MIIFLLYNALCAISAATDPKSMYMDEGYEVYTVKRHFSACEKFMRICQNGPFDKFMRFLFMRSSALRIVMYGAIKIYAVQIYATGA